MIERFYARLAESTARHSRPYERFHYAYLYILPGLLIYSVFVLLPIGNTVRYSLTEWTGFSAPTYVGLANYRRLFEDENFWNALGNNAFFVIFYTILPIMLGLFLTSLMTRSKLRGMVIFRTGLFIPQVMSAVVVGIIWRWMFDYRGPVNQFLTDVGLSSAVKPWLGDFVWAPYAAGLVGTWVEYGLCMVLFIAGVQSISEDLYEAAKVDGANAWHQFRYVTLPGLQQQMLVAFVLTFIAALRVFDLVFVLTRGGPGRKTEVVSMLIYEEAFEYHHAGYASAMAFVMTVIIVSVSATVFYLQSRQEGAENAS
ncbi:MAG TPA: sugar ABC transporter permease [Aggregatilinea sp.]|uniref:carbohydrate ABC transporter permease n=1 Tax=Aggregatilinea sp. TaxID=2806333 RepID=UPI002D1AAB25|nr:sugar ABC transporter permease [Aggregatilinea sp.]HML21172.1 sugar ABC transporter permease [Aggregatilinea sp.]